jgi:hypothetical protein
MEDKKLNEYKDIIAMIKKDSEKIEAPKAVLTSVLEKVTIKKDERLNKQEEVSHPSYISEYFNQFNIFMSKQAYLGAAVVVAIVAAGGLYWYSQNPVVEPGVNYQPTQNAQPTQKTSSAVVATEVTNEVGAFDADLADINDFNSAQNEAELDALSKDLALLNNI